MNMIFKADDDQNLDKVHRRFVDAMAAEGAYFRRDFLRYIAKVLNSVSDSQIRKWIADKDLQGFLKYTRQYLDEFAVRVTKTFRKAAEDEIERLQAPGLFGLGKEKVAFNPGNSRAVAAANRSKYRLIREITDSQRKAIKAAIEDSIRRGAGPLDAARTFRNSIGLTENQYRAVNNYRDLLERGSFEALDRELRDKRFDRTVGRVVDAVEQGEKNFLTKDQIDKMTLRYAENMRRYRSETIARTETMRTMNAAKQESFKQMADALGIDHADVERTWVATLDSKTRDTHAEMNRETVVGIDTPFTSPSGEELMYPGDPTASGDETINCRCTMVVKFPRSKMRYANVE